MYGLHACILLQRVYSCADQASNTNPFRTFKTKKSLKTTNPVRNSKSWLFQSRFIKVCWKVCKANLCDPRRFSRQRWPFFSEWCTRSFGRSFWFWWSRCPWPAEMVPGLPEFVRAGPLAWTSNPSKKQEDFWGSQWSGCGKVVSAFSFPSDTDSRVASSKGSDRVRHLRQHTGGLVWKVAFNLSWRWLSRSYHQFVVHISSRYAHVLLHMYIHSGWLGEDMWHDPWSEPQRIEYWKIWEEIILRKKVITLIIHLKHQMGKPSSTNQTWKSHPCLQGHGSGSRLWHHRSPDYSTHGHPNSVPWGRAWCYGRVEWWWFLFLVLGNAKEMLQHRQVQCRPMKKIQKCWLWKAIQWSMMRDTRKDILSQVFCSELYFPGHFCHRAGH